MLDTALHQPEPKAIRLSSRPLWCIGDGGAQFELSEQVPDASALLVAPMRSDDDEDDGDEEPHRTAPLLQPSPFSFRVRLATGADRELDEVNGLKFSKDFRLKMHRWMAGRCDHGNAVQHLTEALRLDSATPYDRLWHLLNAAVCERRSRMAAAAAGVPPPGDRLFELLRVGGH